MTADELASVTAERDALSLLLRGMARRASTERRRWHGCAEALGYGRGGDPVFIASRMRLMGRAYQAYRQIGADELFAMVREAQGQGPAADSPREWS